MMQDIKMIYALGRSFLAQNGPDEKSEIGRFKIHLFIKVFAMMADRYNNVINLL